MERALDAVADHGAAMTDMGAEVLAVGLHHMKLAQPVAVGHQVLAEVVQRPGLTDREFGRPANHEPAGDFPGEGDFHAGASWLVAAILSTLQYCFQVEEASERG